MHGQEKIPNSKVSDEELIKSLKENGISNFETISLLDKWTVQEETKVGRDPLDSIGFNRRRANIYLKAGFIEEALDNLESAAIQALNEGRVDLRRQIISEIERIVNG